MEGSMPKKTKKHHKKQTTREHQVPKPPLVVKNISHKERARPPKRTPSLEEPSPTSITHFKIEIAWACCNTIDILCL